MKLTVYNVVGQYAANAVDMYFYRLAAGGKSLACSVESFLLTKKMLLK